MTSTSNGGSFSYDANGNMTWRLREGVAYQQSWDYENRLVSVTNQATGQTTTFTYDGDGALVKKETPAGVTYYVGKHYEITSQPEIIDDFEYSDSPLNHGWRVYAGSGSLTTVSGAGRPGRVLRATTDQGTSFGIKYPASGSLDLPYQSLSVWIRDTDRFNFYVRVHATDGQDYYLRYQPTEGGLLLRAVTPSCRWGPSTRTAPGTNWRGTWTPTCGPCSAWE